MLHLPCISHLHLPAALPAQVFFSLIPSGIQKKKTSGKVPQSTQKLTTLSLQMKYIKLIHIFVD